MVYALSCNVPIPIVGSSLSGGDCDGTAIWKTKFKKAWPLVVSGDYDAAAKEVQNSFWYKQTRDRAQAFQKALRALPLKHTAKKR